MSLRHRLSLFGWDYGFQTLVLLGTGACLAVLLA